MSYGKTLLKVFGGVALVAAVITIGEFLLKLKIFTWVIPDWILLTLILLLFVVTAFTAYWISRYGQSGGMPDTINKAKLKPTIEHMFILSALVDRDNQRALKGYLKDCYLRVFDKKTITDFNVVFNELRDRGYVSICGRELTDDCLIPEIGSKYFQRYRKKFGQREGGIPVIPPEIKERYKMAKTF